MRTSTSFVNSFVADTVCPDDSALQYQGKEVKRMNRSKRNSRSCLVDRRPWSQRVGGFTLTELLVVIALVALLLGLLVPCLHAAKKKATQAQCLSNLRSQGMAVQMFANDNQGLFPKVTDLKQVALQVGEALKPYVKTEEIFRCPGDPAKPTPPGGSYDWRLTHDPKTSLAGVRLDLIRQPNSVVIGGDRSPGWHKTNMFNVIKANFSVEPIAKEDMFKSITTPL